MRKEREIEQRDGKVVERGMGVRGHCNAPKKELLTADNLADIICEHLLSLAGCGCDCWHYCRIWEDDADGLHYTDGVAFGHEVSECYPLSPYEGEGIDPRQHTVTLPCCDCHDIEACTETSCVSDPDLDECSCNHCGCDCHDGWHETAHQIAEFVLETVKEETSDE